MSWWFGVFGMLWCWLCIDDVFVGFEYVISKRSGLCVFWVGRPEYVLGCEYILLYMVIDLMYFILI